MSNELITIRPKIKQKGFNQENIGCKRPGYGISPFQFDNLLGKISLQNYEIDDLIDL